MDGVAPTLLDLTPHFVGEYQLMLAELEVLRRAAQQPVEPADSGNLQEVLKAKCDELAKATSDLAVAQKAAHTAAEELDRAKQERNETREELGNQLNGAQCQLRLTRADYEAALERIKVLEESVGGKSGNSKVVAELQRKLDDECEANMELRIKFDDKCDECDRLKDELRGSPKK